MCEIDRERERERERERNREREQLTIKNLQNLRNEVVVKTVPSKSNACLTTLRTVIIDYCMLKAGHHRSV